jgi:hypothetical protein
MRMMHGHVERPAVVTVVRGTGSGSALICAKHFSRRRSSSVKLATYFSTESMIHTEDDAIWMLAPWLQ